MHGRRARLRRSSRSHIHALKPCVNETARLHIPLVTREQGDIIWQLSPGQVDATRFAVRIAFRVTAPVTTRGNLIECTFSIDVQPGNAPERFNIAADVENGLVGWTGANTYNCRSLLINQWYVASLLYDRHCGLTCG
jgi:hypothetical protein